MNQLQEALEQEETSPAIFKGALKVRASQINEEMKLAVAKAAVESGVARV